MQLLGKIQSNFRKQKTDDQKTNNDISQYLLNISNGIVINVQYDSVDLVLYRAGLKNKGLSHYSTIADII